MSIFDHLKKEEMAAASSTTDGSASTSTIDGSSSTQTENDNELSQTKSGSLEADFSSVDSVLDSDIDAGKLHCFSLQIFVTISIYTYVIFSSFLSRRK